MKKRIVGFVCIFIFAVAVTCGIFSENIYAVYVKNIDNIKKFFGFNTGEGVNRAVEEGYVANVEQKYQNSEGIEFSVDSFLIDDYNLAVHFLVNLDEKYDLNEFSSVFINDLKIVDEDENNVIFPSDGGYSISSTNIGENKLEVVLSASNTISTFPKSKKMIVTFTEFVAHKNNKEEVIDKIYKGDWKFELDVPEQMYKREVLVYTQKDCNDKNTFVTKAIVSNTALIVELSSSSKKIDFEKVNKYDNISIYHAIALSRGYVETSDGKRFEESRGMGENGGYEITDDNIVKYRVAYDLTKFDATNEITLHILTNTDKELVITLERKNDK